MRNHTQAYTNTMIGDLKDMTKRLEGVVVPEEIIRSAARRCRTPAASPSDVTYLPSFNGSGVLTFSLKYGQSQISLRYPSPSLASHEEMSSSTLSSMSFILVVVQVATAATAVANGASKNVENWGRRPWFRTLLNSNKISTISWPIFWSYRWKLIVGQNVSTKKVFLSFGQISRRLVSNIWKCPPLSFSKSPIE